jgi:hypothetical protein
LECKDLRAYSRLFLNADEPVIAAVCQLVPCIEGRDLHRLMGGFPWEAATIALGSIVFLLYIISSMSHSAGRLTFWKMSSTPISTVNSASSNFSPAFLDFSNHPTPTMYGLSS